MTYYYVTLCAVYRGKYVTVFARNMEEAYRLAVKELGVLNVSTAYTERLFKHKKPYFKYFCEIYNPAKDEYLRRKRII